MGDAVRVLEAQSAGASPGRQSLGKSPRKQAAGGRTLGSQAPTTHQDICARTPAAGGQGMAPSWCTLRGAFSEHSRPPEGPTLRLELWSPRTSSQYTRPQLGSPTRRPRTSSGPGFPCPALDLVGSEAPLLLFPEAASLLLLSRVLAAITYLYLSQAPIVVPGH